jgi:hypothetical protein
MVGWGFTVIVAILPEVMGTEQPVEAELIEIFVKLVTPLLAKTWVLKDPVPPLIVTAVWTLDAVLAPVRL